MIWNRDGIIWYSEDEVESYKQSEQEGLEIVAELEAENKVLKKNANVFQKYITQNEQLKTEIDYLVKKNEKLKAENARLKENDCEQCKHLDLYIKYKQTLQEIKAIAKGVRSYLEVPASRDVRYEMDRILHLTIKAEEE